MNLKLLKGNNIDTLFTALIAVLTMICFSGFSVSVVKTCMCFLPMLQ